MSSTTTEVGEKRDAQSNNSSATSAGENTEPPLKKARSIFPGTLSFDPNLGQAIPTPLSNPEMLLTPKKPIISVFAAENVTPPHRPNISISTGLLVPPIKSEPILESINGPGPSTISIPSISTPLPTTGLGLFSSQTSVANPLTMSFSAQNTVSNNSIGLFAGRPSQNFTSNTGSFLWKNEDKEKILFQSDNRYKNMRVGVKTEKDMLQCLFGVSSNKTQGVIDGNTQTLAKDPHGLNWLEECKNDGGKIGKVKKKEKEIPAERKKVDRKIENPFDFTRSLKKHLPVFYNVSEPVKKCQKVEDVYEEFDRRFNMAKDHDFVYKNVFIAMVDPTDKSSETQKIYSNESEDERPKIYIPQGYITKPKPKTLSSLSISELKSIKKLKIKNQFGKIVFKKPVDLTETNILSNVHIEQGAINLYNNFANLPPNGVGLNIPAEITLYKCKPDKPVPSNDFVEVLAILCQSFSAKHKKWNPKTGEWVFKVKNFSAFK